MTLDTRTVQWVVRAEATALRNQVEDPYDRARAGERAVYAALTRARARVWEHFHWWGRDDVDTAPQH